MTAPAGRPPRAAEWLLRRLHADNGAYTHLGDFAEVFAALCAEKKRTRAVLQYWGHVFRSVPGFIANKIYWSSSMLRNYAVISCRTIVKNAGYSLISLLGLAVGLASFILILAYVRFETSYDRFHEKSGRIYRVLSGDAPAGQKPGEFATNQPSLLAALLKTEFPEVRHAARVFVRTDMPAVLQDREKPLTRNGMIVDQDFLEVLSFPLLEGDRSSALAAPASIVLTASTARALFGREDPLGRRISFRTERATADVAVTGIVEDPPRNSHFRFDYLVSVATLESDEKNGYMFNNWNVGNFTIYAELSGPGQRAALEAKLGSWLEKNRPADTPASQRLFLQPVEDIHLRSNIGGEPTTNNEIRTVSLFLAIAVLILLIASVNYMNLVTARASTRAREIGIRKVTGADRRQLIRQFLGESVLFAFLALAAALAVARLALARFNAVAGVGLGFRDLLEPSFFLLVAGATLAVGLLAGAYPALALSAFQAAKVLKEHAASGRKGFRLRNVLVVGQFTASIALLVCAMVVSGQLRFVTLQKLGYDRENVVVIPLREPETAAKAGAIRDELLRHPEVESASITSGLPTGIRSRLGNVKLKTDRGEPVTMSYAFDYVDANFLEVFRIPLVAGRNFSPGLDDGRGAAIINEAFIKQAGWAEPIGKDIGFFATTRVVGVVEDFHFRSFRDRISPMALILRPGDKLAVRLRPGDVPKSVALLKGVFERLTGTQSFDFSFLDDDFDALYRKERRTGQIFGAFAFLAVFIACLGLLGLAAFAVERRTKEIGVRKVLGASAPGLAVKLSREFVALVLLANIIAWPIAYFAMSRWLRAFAYRIPLGARMFLMAALGALFLALLTVSTQTLRAASANPVESLRYE